MKNKAKKAMREKAEEAPNELKNWMLRLAKGFMTGSKDVEGGGD